jgi:hypothetical protein
MERIEPPGTPRYARSTASATLRAITTIPSRSPSSKSELARQQFRDKNEKLTPRRPGKGATFFDLPFELRLQIYAACLTPGFNGVARILWGWIKGGGHHYEYGRGFHNLYLYADCKFPLHLLLICKAISKEARIEIYRMIRFKINAPDSAHVPQALYWLTTHPLRFTSHLEIPFGINIMRRPSKAAQLKKQDVTLLARAIAAMPYLRILEIPLIFHSEAGYFWSPNPRAMRSLSKKCLDNIFEPLFRLRKILPRRAQLRIDAEFASSDHSTYHTGPNKGLTEEKKETLITFLKDNGFVFRESKPNHCNPWHF